MSSRSAGPWVYIFITGAGFVYNSWADRRRERFNRQQEQLKNQIEWVNRQVADLYGVLVTSFHSTRRAYQHMLNTLTDDGSPDTLRSLVQNDPTGETAEEFRRWQTGVLQPLNRRAAETIMEHADLTDSLAHVPVMLQFVAHVNAYNVVLQRWATGSLDALATTRPGIHYPDELPDIVEGEYIRLKNRQATLLGLQQQTVSRL